MLSNILTPFISDFNILANDRIYLTIVLIYAYYSLYTDFNFFIIPQKVSFAMVIIRLLLIPFYGFTMNSFLGGLIPFLLFWTIAAILNQNMGGDIKFVGAIGLWLGLNVMIAVILTSCVLSLTYVLYTKIFKKESSKIAYAVYFALSLTLLLVYVR